MWDVGVGGFSRRWGGRVGELGARLVCAARRHGACWDMVTRVESLAGDSAACVLFEFAAYMLVRARVRARYAVWRKGRVGLHRKEGCKQTTGGIQSSHWPRLLRTCGYA